LIHVVGRATLQLANPLAGHQRRRHGNRHVNMRFRTTDFMDKKRPAS
jgi:hypothetical protein